MRKLIAAMGGALLGSLLLVATVAAADPTPTPSATPVVRTNIVATVLGLTQAQLQDLRHDGLSLAQIATKQNVDVKNIIDALVARWRERIDARVASGALTPAEAAKLQAQLTTQAQTMVNKTTLGGMQGAAVGAGPGTGNGTGNGNGNRGGAGAGTGTGTCDGTGRP
jgi:hypothetical protein